jgi:hypothetical protein
MAEVVLGALEPDLGDQIKAAGLPVSDDYAADMTRIADSITFLHLRGILSDGETATARQRVVRKLKKHLAEKGGGSAKF